VGDAYALDFFPVDQGLICVQRERKAEDLSEDACIDLQYVYKDSWDHSDSDKPIGASPGCNYVLTRMVIHII
jgi:hypothetical protein